MSIIAAAVSAFIMHPVTLGAIALISLGFIAQRANSSEGPR